MEETTKKNPIKVFRCGPVKAAIWSNARTIDGMLAELHSIKIDRSYKDGEAWKHTNTFYAEDLPKVAMVATEAYKFIRVKSSEQDDPV